jgi:hypothetical protein
MLTQAQTRPQQSAIASRNERDHQPAESAARFLIDVDNRLIPVDYD